MPSGGDSKGDDDNDLGEGAALGCTERCTDAADTGGTGATGDRFAAALAMIATLPLTDAEKAETVRRLLAIGGGTTGGER